MLQNAYFLAKIGADTAENERNFAEILPKIVNYLKHPRGRPKDRVPRGGRRGGRGGGRLLPRRRARAGGRCAGVNRAFRVRGLGLAKLANLAIFCKFCRFLAGSFSAISKRNFARKYAFDSIFQSLQDVHTFVPLQTKNLRKKSV